MEESDLIKRLKQGDEQAFEWLFKQHFRELCLYAEHFVKDEIAAEEIVEDFFCTFWDNCKTIVITSALKGYLFRSVHNRCLNYIRHRKIESRYLENQKYYFTDAEILDVGYNNNSLTELFTAELEEKITRAIDKLPEQCRKTFQLNRFENMSYQDIAEKLNISVNTVKTQMTRALQKIRVDLGDYLTFIAFLLICFAG
jgi:RNA polymerase sigma-70 factor (ECF subfamily)